MLSGILDAFAPSGKANITQRVIEDADAVVEVTADQVRIMRSLCECKGSIECLTFRLKTTLSQVTAVTFPTADVLGDLRGVAKKNSRLTMIVNAQWFTSGQLISDFGAANSDDG